MSFDYELDFKTVDFRRRPELYRIGKGARKTKGAAILSRPSECLIYENWETGTRTPKA
ncbi:MAG: hypothetical protein QOG71_352 [Pyrinomonadaceae bacterium]|nr:hypothetical protein [Pyrinomonadaceae bacterium]